MDVLGLLEILQLVTYAFEGSHNYYHTLVEVRKNWVNIHQENKTFDKRYHILFWTVVYALKLCGSSVTIYPGPINRKIDKMA